MEGGRGGGDGGGGGVSCEGGGRQADLILTVNVPSVRTELCYYGNTLTALTVL